MKGSNLFYGVLLLLLAYFLFIPSFNFSFWGFSVPLPNPFFYLGQLTLPVPLLNHIPLLIYVGLLGIVCIVTAFSSDKTIVVRESRR